MKAGWQKITVGEAFTTATGGTPPKIDDSLYGDYIPFVKPPELNDTTIETAVDGLSHDGAKVARTLPANSILVSCIGNLGKVGLNTIPVAFNQQINAILPNEKIALPWFMFYQVLGTAFKEQLEAQASGTTVPIVNKSKFNSLAIVLPEINEQQRIVTLLDEAFADITTAKANAEKNLQNARELCESLMQALFPDDENVAPDSPSLDSLCELIVDCEHKTAPTQETGIPSIRTPNIGKGRLILEGVYRVSDETYAEWTRRGEPQGGDLILAREAPAGNVAVIPEGTKVCLGQRTVLIRPKKSVFEPAYLAQLLLRQNSQRRLLAHSRGATVQHINMKDIRAFKIGAIPSLADQQRIVSQVDELFDTEDRLVSIYRQKLTALDDLKKSLLHQAFSGQL